MLGRTGCCDETYKKLVYKTLSNLFNVMADLEMFTQPRHACGIAQSFNKQRANAFAFRRIS